MSRLISPFARGTVLDPEQGGTGIDGDTLQEGQVVGYAGEGIGAVDLIAGDNITINTDTPGEIVINAGGGGGLQFFTEAQNTAAPNNVVNVDSLTATGATAAVDVAIVPKGTGAILAAVPTNTAAGGNKRGNYAVDLQVSRNIATQVASGAYSAIGGGRWNTSSANYATVGGGTSNQSTAEGSTIAGGGSNRAFGPYAFVGGGTTCWANADYAVNCGGNTNTVSAQSGVCIGGESINVTALYAVGLGGIGNISNGTYSITSGQYATARGISAYEAHGLATFANAGGSQRGRLLMKATTADATTTVLRSTTAAAGTTNQVILPNNAAYFVKGSIIGQDTGTGDASAWTFEGVITRGASAATTALVAAIAPALVAQSAGAAAWTVAVEADTVNGGLKISVTGEAAKNINWLSNVETLEAAYL